MAAEITRTVLLEQFHLLTREHYQDDFPSLEPLLLKLVQAVPQDAFTSYLPTNRVNLIGYLDADNSKEFIEDVLVAHNNAPADLPIEVLLSSRGGDIEQGLAIMSVLSQIRREGRQVHIHVAGWAWSMAFDILQIADHRAMEPTAFLMTHEEQYEVEGSTSVHKSEAEFARSQELAFYEILSKRTGRPVSYYVAKVKNRDWYIGAEEALAEGLIDEVGVIPPFALTPAAAGRAPVPTRKKRVKATAPAAEAV